MTLDELKSILISNAADDTVLFENPDYADAFIGLDIDNRAVYSYTKMIQSLINSDGMTDEDAREFIDYNTIRSLPYAGNKSPIIVYDDIYDDVVLH